MKTFRELVEVSLAKKLNVRMAQATGRQKRKKDFRKKTNSISPFARGSFRKQVFSRYPSGHIPVKSHS